MYAVSIPDPMPVRPVPLDDHGFRRLARDWFRRPPKPAPEAQASGLLPRTERPRIVLIDWRQGDRRIRIRRGQCASCRCSLARDERKCRRCPSKRVGKPRLHIRSAPTWTDDFEALRAHAARSNWPRARGSSRASRARDPEAYEDVRVTITLPTNDEQSALRKLLKHPIRRGFDRWEWLSSVWIELMGPPPDIDMSEDLDERIKRAIWRAEKSLRAQK